MQLVPVELLFVATQRVTARTMAIYLLWSFLDNRDLQIVHFTIYCYRMSIVSAALCVYLWNPGCCILYHTETRISLYIRLENTDRMHRNTHPICGIISSTGLNRRTLGWLAFFLKCHHITRFLIYEQIVVVYRNYFSVSPVPRNTLVPVDLCWHPSAVKSVTFLTSF